MDTLLRITEVVLPLILIIFFGFFLSRKNLISDSFAQEGSKSVFNIFLPISMFTSIYRTSGDETINFNLIIFIFIFLFIAVFISLSIFKKLKFDNEEIVILLLTIFRCNILLFGLPLSQNYYGESEVNLITMYIGTIATFANIGAIVVCETLTSKKFDFNKLFKSIITNRILIAIFSAVVLKNLKISLPNSLLKSMKDLGGIATPLGLLCIGAMIDFKKDKHENEIIYTGIVARSLILPIIGVTVASMLGIREKELFVSMLIFAAPAAVSNHAMSVIYTSKGKTGGKLVMYSTVFNSLTIFIFLYILTMLGYLE